MSDGFINIGNKNDLFQENCKNIFINKNIFCRLKNSIFLCSIPIHKIVFSGTKIQQNPFI